MNALAVMANFFGLALSALLPLVNPLGSALVFLGLVGDAPPAVFRGLAVQIAIRTTVFLAAVELAGSALLRFFGISLPVVEVSGGLVLAAMGWNMLKQGDTGADADRELVADARFKSLQQRLFYPLTFPITAGPGCIVVTLTLTAHASKSEILATVAAHVGIFLAIAALSVLVFFCYAYAPRVAATVSPQTAHGILRVVAFVLLSIGVQITWNGVESLLQVVPHH